MVPTWHNLLHLAYSTSRDKSLGQRAEVLTELIGRKTKLHTVSNETVMEIINNLKAKELTGSTINRYLSILSKVVSVYRRTYNPTFSLYIPWQREGSGRFEWLKSEDEAKVIAYLEAKGAKDIALCIRLLTITGMRLGEFLSLELSQVDDDWVRLWETKTNRPRSLPLPAGMGAQLRQLIERGIPRGYSIRTGLREALRASGVNSNITPHSLRHTTATRLVKQGVNLLVAGRYLGHNSLKTTQRYVHIEDSDIRSAMEKIFDCDSLATTSKNSG
jgi:site-specific recombinase XerD